jgi:hypothetical protein
MHQEERVLCKNISQKKQDEIISRQQGDTKRYQIKELRRDGGLSILQTLISTQRPKRIIPSRPERQSTNINPEEASHAKITKTPEDAATAAARGRQDGTASLPKDATGAARVLRIVLDAVQMIGVRSGSRQPRERRYDSLSQKLDKT